MLSARRLGVAVALGLVAVGALDACGSTSSSGGVDDSGLGGFGGTGGATGGSSGVGASGGTGGSSGSGATGGTAGSGAAGGTGGQAGATSDAGSDASDAESDATADAQDATIDVGDASTGQRLVMTEGSANRIYVLDTLGNILANFPSPVTSPRGVACDLTLKDGFFVMGTADANKIYKLAWNGTPLAPITFATPLPNPSTMRGLDYFVDVGGDRLVFVYQNVNSIDVVQAADLAGVTQLQSSHYKGGFLSGFWGVLAVGPASGGDIERWSSWGDGTLQRWVGSQTQAQVLTPGLGALRGLTRDGSGGFWVVAGTQLKHLDATGTTLGGFAAPSSNPQDISYTD